jgi:hypothetical protein
MIAEERILKSALVRLSLCDHEDRVDLFIGTIIYFVVSVEGKVTK